MEIPRHWRTRRQRLRLEGFKITKIDGTIKYEFPPKARSEILYNSNLLLPPDNQVVYCEIVGKDQEQDHKSQN